jgi:hypothetical protein
VRPALVTKWEEAILKISLIDSARQRRLIVEGELIAPWAAELRSGYERHREIVVDMKNNISAHRAM